VKPPLRTKSIGFKVSEEVTLVLTFRQKLRIISSISFKFAVFFTLRKQGQVNIDNTN
jgi:hypothetical protein